MYVTYFIVQHNQVMFPQEHELQRSYVVGRKEDIYVKPVVTENSSIILNTCVQKVRFYYERVQVYTTNIITENLYSLLDREGCDYLLIDDIMEYKSYWVDVRVDKVFVEGSSSNRHKHKNTKDWSLLVQVKDRHLSYGRLKYLKENNSVEVAQYPIDNNIFSYLEFNWWVSEGLHWRLRII